jgi:hypothetical protein
MLKLKRILLIAPSEMTRTPAFDRAHALACATGTGGLLAGASSLAGSASPVSLSKRPLMC